MLIDSKRITIDDRKLWDELQEIDVYRSKDTGYVYHKRKTLDIIKEFIDRKERYFVAVSWGKDSVVLADMFSRMGAECKYVYLRNIGREPPENQEVKKAFLKTHDLDYVEISYDYSKADETYFDRNGKPSKWQNLLKYLKEEYGCHVTGIRYDESAKRKRRFIFMGLETEYSFAPFRHFTCQDIFAYMYEYDIPIHPNYAMLGGGRWDKYRLRVSAIGNPEGDGMGRAQWEKEYYPDILSRLGAI